jgi:acylglycerol lipase
LIGSPKQLKILTLVLALFLFTSGIVWADNDHRDRYTFVQDGEISKQVHLPTYEWLTKKVPPDGMVLAIHGLTLHGLRYDIVARAFAADNPIGSYYVLAPDMRGFGRNRNKDHTFCQGKDCKRKVDYTKTVDDMSTIAKLMREKYPGAPLYLMGESLGSSMCLAVAAKHPELVDGLVLSAPAERVNPLMYKDPRIIASGLFAVFIDPKFNMGLNTFMKNLVSNDPNVVKEMMDDPLVPKKMTLAELLKTDHFIARTNKFAKNVKTDLPVLILQGSEDKCVVPDSVAKLAERIPSSDQTMRWMHAHGHLLLETTFLRAATVDAITDWFDSHTPAHKQELGKVRDDIKALGGKMPD